MSLQAKFCTRRWNLSYQGFYNPACEPTSNRTWWYCWLPLDSGAMNWYSTMLKAQGGVPFDAEVTFGITFKNTGTFTTSAYVQLNSEPRVQQNIDAGASWAAQTVADFQNITQIAAQGQGGNSIIRITAGFITVAGGTI